jgi:hypothetical protein
LHNKQFYNFMLLTFKTIYSSFLDDYEMKILCENLSKIELNEEKCDLA